MEWLALGLPHNGSHLFGRLPFDDAIRLAALVGTGQLTWTEVNAALDAKIKLAVARLRARRGNGVASFDPHEAWEAARRGRLPEDLSADEVWEFAWEMVNEHNQLAAQHGGPDARRAMKQRGFLLSTDGPAHNVIKIKPPMVVAEEDLERFLAQLDAVFQRV